MFKESEHPRNEDGTFKEKEKASKLLGVELKTAKELRNELKAKNSPNLNINKVSNVELEHLLKIYNGKVPDDVLYLDYVSENDAKEKIENEIKKNKEKYNANVLQKQQEIEQTKKADEYNIKSIVDLGFTNEQAQKLNNIEKRFEANKKDVALKLLNAKDGYVGFSKSKRALESEIDGKFPLTKASEILGISKEKVKEHFSTNGEWHHTGAFYNETNYYDISKIINYDENVDFVKQVLGGQ